MFDRASRARISRESLQSSFAEIGFAHQIFNENSSPIDPENSAPMRQLVSQAELFADFLKERILKLVGGEGFAFEPTIERHLLGKSSGMCSLLILPSIESGEKTEGYLLPPLSDLQELHGLRIEGGNSQDSSPSKAKKLLVASGYQEAQIETLRSPIALAVRDTAKISAQGTFESPVEIVVLWSKAAFKEACDNFTAKIAQLGDHPSSESQSKEEAKIQALKRGTSRGREHRNHQARSLFPLGMDSLVEAVPGYLSETIREGIISQLEKLSHQGRAVSDATILGIEHINGALNINIEFHGGEAFKQIARVERDINGGEVTIRWADLHSTADLSQFKMPTF